MQQEITIRKGQRGIGKPITLKCEDAVLKIVFAEAKDHLHIVYRQVLKASFHHENDVLEVIYLHRKKEAGPLALVTLEGRPQNLESDQVIQWAENLMRNAYEDSGVQRKRRLKILLNPHGGVRKALSLFYNTVEPIFHAAQCAMDVIHTTHQGHALEIAKDLDLDYDAVVTVSGDGIIHEVMNGFALHKNPKRAFSIPIAPIPAGSGNALSLNLLGVEHGFDVTEAALNVIKGKKMKIDVFSITQNGKRTISFMSQALGLMADVDVGTDNLRWMGETRFLVGLIRGVIQFKPCPIKLSYKLAESDKMKMVNDLKLRNQNQAEQVPGLDDGGELPPLVDLSEDTDGWITYNEPILYVYAGKGPFVARDYMAFPVSLPDDGLIDLSVYPVYSRKVILSNIGNAATGEGYWEPHLRYVKAHTYRVKPFSPKGALAVDGEKLPFQEFQVEVHRKLATVLSPYGCYAAEFSSTNKASSGKFKGKKEVQ